MAMIVVPDELYLHNEFMVALNGYIFEARSPRSLSKSYAIGLGVYVNYPPWQCNNIEAQKQWSKGPDYMPVLYFLHYSVVTNHYP